MYRKHIPSGQPFPVTESTPAPVSKELRMPFEGWLLLYFLGLSAFGGGGLWMICSEFRPLSILSTFGGLATCVLVVLCESRFYRW